MLIMVCYLKKICGINQAEDRVTWPNLLHQHTSALASFREWSVVSAWLRIRAQPRNPCQPRNSASASTWISRHKLSQNVNFVRLLPSWNSVFGTMWLRFSSQPRFRTRAHNPVGLDLLIPDSGPGPESSWALSPRPSDPEIPDDPRFRPRPRIQLGLDLVKWHNSKADPISSSLRPHRSPNILLQFRSAGLFTPWL